MNRRGGWLAPALLILGLAGVALAVARGGRWALVAAAGSAAFVCGLTVPALVRRLPRKPRARALDFSHTLDLLRRAHDAHACWAVGLREGDVESLGEREVHEDRRRRGAALAQLASVDGRVHVSREPHGTYVAVGDFPYGAGVLLAWPDAGAEFTDPVADELRRLVATMRLAELELPEAQGLVVAKQLALAASGTQTLEGVARAAVELAQPLAQRGAAVVTLEGAGAGVHVVATSNLVDKRLAGLTLSPEAPVARAIHTGLPVVTEGGEDVFGPGVPERRRRERAGTAYPLLDGHVVVGALVLIGPPLDPDAPVADQLGGLMSELGPRLAAARALHEAERRGLLDPLTGLCNRREFERVLERYAAEVKTKLEPATLVYSDLDRFKGLNDTLGHAAGDAALRHVAGLLQGAVRDGDLVARIGGEEFAVWLPRTPLAEGLEVAERIRRGVEGTAWRWNGGTHTITISCGVAGFPDPVRDVANLRGAADAALYRAKQAGRNRVEKATAAS